MALLKCLPSCMRLNMPYEQCRASSTGVREPGLDKRSRTEGRHLGGVHWLEAAYDQQGEMGSCANAYIDDGGIALMPS